MSRFYRWLYIWALARWRKSVGNPNLMNKKATVTVHALLRYAQRFDNYDPFKNILKLNNAGVRQKIREIGGSGKFTHDGIVFTVEKGSVITVAKPANEERAHLTYQPLNGEKGRKWTF